jgi:hypothetical protein
MPVWKISSIEDRPQVTLEEWAVFEVPLNGPDQPLTRHLAGRSCEDCQGQVSSPVLAFDPNSGAFRTRSGRVYRLVGLPGLCADGSYGPKQMAGPPRLRQSPRCHGTGFRGDLRRADRQGGALMERAPVPEDFPRKDK